MRKAGWRILTFEEELKQKTAEMEEILYSFLPKEEGYASTVISAMNYSVKAGGKRLRPIFMNEIFRMFGGKGKVIHPFLAAQEMIHTYSLVHDDLEVMDNDEFRRGRKTTHVVYGEAMAVLAGDGLLNMAFETALKAFEVRGASKKQVICALKILAEKAGLKGMLGGQAVDVDLEVKQSSISDEVLTFIHENKTGALIQSSMMIGAVLAGASEETVSEIDRMSLLIGTAFQIEDDILDVTGNEETTGKPVGSDAKNNKTTYVTRFGLEKAREDARCMSEEALRIFDSFSEKNEFLRRLIESLTGRDR